MVNAAGIEKENMVKVAAIGGMAYELICKSKSGQIIGITSHGIFISFEHKRVIFLTADQWHGPLTLNLTNVVLSENIFNLHDDVKIDALFIHASNLLIEIPGKSVIWEPEEKTFAKAHFKKIFDRCMEFSSSIRNQANGSYFEPLFSIVSNTESPVDYKKKQFKEFLGIEEDVDIVNDIHLRKFLGLGLGLTPAGDDFIIGYLLTDYYLSHVLSNRQELLDIAWKQTTALSASLMECAVEGSGDERLIHLLSFLIEGKGNLGKIKEELLSYGSSSGIETLAGMISAIYLYISY